MSGPPGLRLGPYLIQYCKSITHRKGFLVLVVRDNSIRWTL